MKKYKIQSYDHDCECWEDWSSDSGLDDPKNEFSSRHEAEDEIRHLKQRYCCLKLKVVAV